MRLRRADSDVLGYMRTIRAVYPARQRIYWIQDNLSANWTPDIRAYAAVNKIELIPTPADASDRNRIESHFRPMQEFVFTTPTTPTGTPPSAPWDITDRKAPTATGGSPPWNANTESPHDVISGQTFALTPLAPAPGERHGKIERRDNSGRTRGRCGGDDQMADALLNHQLGRAL